MLLSSALITASIKLTAKLNSTSYTQPDTDRLYWEIIVALQ